MQTSIPQNNDHKIVRFTNIAGFDFTPEMGAMYGGTPYFVPAGKSMLMPMPFGQHLATHLARQIIIQKAPIRDAGELDGKGTDRKLWDQTAIDELKAMIVKEVYDEERPAPTTPEEIMKRRIEDLNKDFPPEVIAAAARSLQQEALTPAVVGGSVPPTAPAPTIASTEARVLEAPKEYKDKAEVIEALKTANIKFDARKSRADLEKLLPKT